MIYYLEHDNKCISRNIVYRGTSAVLMTLRNEESSTINQLCHFHPIKFKKCQGITKTF